jgi:hypothetical protein
LEDDARDRPPLLLDVRVALNRRVMRIGIPCMGCDVRVKECRMTRLWLICSPDDKRGRPHILSLLIRTIACAAVLAALVLVSAHTAVVLADYARAFIVAIAALWVASWLHAAHRTTVISESVSR